MKLRKKHGIRLEHTDYVQIHPTTLYSKKPGRRFLISESVRGEGAVLLDKEGNRFVNELLPRDVVTKAIREQMEKRRNRSCVAVYGEYRNRVDIESFSEYIQTL